MKLVSVLVVFGLATVYGDDVGSEQGGKYFVAGKRNGGFVASGQIHPRLGRGFHDSPKGLLPYSRLLRRPLWRTPLEVVLAEYEDSSSSSVGTDGLSPVSVSNLINAAGGDPTLLSSGDDNEVEKRNGANGGNMWFGPRLGKRRKRSVDMTSEEAREAGLVNRILRSFNWQITPVKPHRTFTPRLGRSGSSKEASVYHGSHPFSPRLGRSGEVATPAIFESEEDDENVSRYARSESSSGGSNTASKGHSTQPPSDDASLSASAMMYSPRLGRDHYSPRLGRSGPAEDRE